MITIISTCKYKLSEEEFVRPIVEIVKGFGLDYGIRRYNERIEIDDRSKVIICGTALRDFDYLNYIDNFTWLTDYDGEVLGICAGYNILAMVYSNELEEVKKIGVYDVMVVKDNPLVEKGSIRSYFLHTYALKMINNNLECLAVQDDEICIFKVKNKNFYGVSFHPEVLNKEIITNFLKL